MYVVYKYLVQYTCRKSEEDTQTLQECLTKIINLLLMPRHNSYIIIFTTLILITIIVIQIHSIIIHVVVTVIILFTLIITTSFTVVVYWPVCVCVCARVYVYMK